MNTSILYLFLGIYAIEKRCEAKKAASQRETAFGGLEGIRTLDPHNANVVRSQLRYKPVQKGLYRLKKKLSRATKMKF